MFYLILAFVQAATEFLPVSSSGHLLFLKGVFGIRDIPVVFDIVLHVGSLIAIVFFYRQRLMGTVRGMVTEWSQHKQSKPDTRFVVYLILSTSVTFVFYLFLKDPIELSVQRPAVLFLTYLLTTVILFSTYFANTDSKQTVSNKRWTIALLVGFSQGLAILPGVSRSGATISSLLLTGVRKDDAAYYSFSLAIPAILGALVFKLSEVDNMTFVMANWRILILAFTLSVVFSYLFLVLLKLVLKRKVFWLFSLYTAAMAIASLILFSS